MGIPNNWKVVPIRDLIEEIKNGFASGKRDKNGIVQVRMNNVTTDGRLRFNSYLKVPTPTSLEDWLLKKGDFLFNNTNSYELVGKSTIFYEAPFPCTFSNHFTRIRFKKEFVVPQIILSHFILLWKKGYFKAVAIRHVGQSAVHTKYLLKIKISLPPLPEQQKIAEILATVDETIHKVDEAIVKTQALKQGLMQELLTKGIGHREFKDSEIGRIPREWEVAKIKDIGEVFTGKTPPTINKKFWNGDIPFITPGDIKDRKFVYDTERCVTLEGAKTIGVIPKGGVLVVCIGSTIGKVGMAYENCITNQQINSVLCKGNFNPHYIYYSVAFRSNILKSYSGVAAVPIIKKSLFEKFKLAISKDVNEQQKIADILSVVDQRLELEQKRKNTLEKIKSGLMEDLLTGGKRVRV